MKGEIYKITNLVNGKSYVGQTRIGYKKRMVEHIWTAGRGRSSTPLYKAIRKYGADAFLIELLDVVDEDQLDMAEVNWIEKIRCLAPDGYNATTGGNSRKQYCEESKIKTSEKLKGKKRPPHVVEKIAAALKNRKISADQMRQLHEKNTGSKRTPEQRARISAGRAGKGMSAEGDTNNRKYQREYKRKKTAEKILADMKNDS